MFRSILLITAALTATFVAGAQQQRRASITGGGDPSSGKCTIEVVVDGAADVEIRGDTASLRNSWGQPPQWRRFECTSRMPINPANFRFQGVDGRGRQDLTRDPRNGGPAVVHIEDKDSGSEGYTFDIFWGGGGYPQNQRPGAPPPYGDRPVERDRDRYPGSPIPGGARFTANEAIRACREDVRGRAAERFGTGINFQDMRMEDNPDRRDWVLGSFTTQRDGGRLHRFACSVDFQNGNVRWAQIDPPGDRFDNGPPARYSPRRDAVQSCQNDVDGRMRQRGLRDVTFGRIGVDDKPGRNDWVIGDVRGNRDGRWESFNFACRVDLNDGDVRSVDLNRR